MPNFSEHMPIIWITCNCTMHICISEKVKQEGDIRIRKNVLMDIAQIAFDTHPSNWQLRKVVLFSAECTESGITQIVAKDLNHILPQILI